ncbi:MAG TPA: hypothetical protein VFE45_03425, partial [Coriobacteriia bacterium]|nr:hypothetical protein [Coriobacteriia bacterium]
MGVDERLREIGFFVGPLGLERCGVVLESLPSAKNLNAHISVGDSRNIDAQAEAVEQLGPKLPLLGVHRPNEDEPSGMRDRNPLSLDDIDAACCNVEQNVDE